MKLLNFDTRELIYQNLRYTTVTAPEAYTYKQYKILYSLIQRKKITKQSFDILLSELYGLSDWKQLTYHQMYELIFILSHWNYEKVRM